MSTVSLYTQDCKGREAHGYQVKLVEQNFQNSRSLEIKCPDQRCSVIVLLVLSKCSIEQHVTIKIHPLQGETALQNYSIFSPPPHPDLENPVAAFKKFNFVNI